MFKSRNDPQEQAYETFSSSVNQHSRAMSALNTARQKAVEQAEPVPESGPIERIFTIGKKAIETVRLTLEEGSSADEELCLAGAELKLATGEPLTINEIAVLGQNGQSVAFKPFH